VIVATAFGWTILGLFGQALFGLRLVLQWVASERAKKTVVPPWYWRIGLAGGFLVLVYAVAVGNAIFSLSVIPGIFISGRNLRIKRVRTRHTLIAWMIPFILLAAAAIAFQRKVGTPIWAAIGFTGSGLWALRSFVQWWVSERSGRSQLPRLFWWLSLVGSVLLLAYAISRQDVVMTVGYAMGCVPYLRNLILMRRRESISKFDTSSITPDPTRPTSQIGQSGDSSP